MINNPENKFNLEKRTTKFSIDVLDLCKSNQTGRVTEKVTNETFNFTEAPSLDG